MGAVVVGASFALMVGGARADAPTLRARGQDGGFDLALFAEPTPLRAGGASLLSVLVQRADATTPILDARVHLRLTPPAGGGDPLDLAASPDGAANRLLHAVPVELSVPGAWTVRVEVERGVERGALDATLEVAPEAGPLGELWPYLIAPFAALALFALHQVLARRRA